MRQYSLLFIILGLLISGCSRRSNPSKSVAVYTEKETVLPGIADQTIYTDNDETFFITIRAEDENAPDRRSRRSDRSQRESGSPSRIVPIITFADNETQHVRITSYDPFEQGNQIVIDLDRLKEEFVYPYDGKFLSKYGMRGRSMHTGIDIKALPNDTIRAAMDGVVRMSKMYSSYGNVIVIRHYNGLETVYSHNSKNLVKPNDVVKAGEPIGLAGRTGRATTEHLHFEIRVMGEHFNPDLMVDPENKTLKRGKLYVTRNNGRILASNSERESTRQATQLASNTTRTETPTVTSTGSSSSSGASTHTVKRGDTLYSISRAYGTTVNNLCSLNGISATSILNIGQRLRVK